MSKKKYPQYVLKQDTMFCEKDSRKDGYLKVKERTGVSPDECWELGYSLACFMVPRLEMFIMDAVGFPCDMGSEENWKKALRKMLYAFRRIRDEKCLDDDPKFDEGIGLFKEYMLSLWY